MVAYPSWLRGCAALFLAVAVAGLGIGCSHGSGSGGSTTVSGHIYFTRTDVAYTQGAATGLGASEAGQIARGIQVRAFQLYSETGPSGTTSKVWHLAGTAVTDDSGYYSIGVSHDQDYPTFVEVDSIYQELSGNQASVKLIADPAGIRSTANADKRPIYVYRRDVGGNVLNTAGTDPVVNPSGVASLTGSASVDADLGASDTWAVTLPTWYLPTSPASTPSAWLALGSRPLGILDQVWAFEYHFGDPTPSATSGGVLDLHYYPGRTDYVTDTGSTTQRSFVVYDYRNTLPQSFDGTKYHYFGTLAAGPTTDDAWDPGVIIPMLARNHLFGLGKTALFPVGRSNLASLAPDLLVVDAWADAMAASYLKTPYLTDTQSTAPFQPRDIRVLPGTQGANCPANWAAAGWKVILRANLINDSYLAWPSIDPDVTRRYFRLIYPTVEQTTTFSGNVWVRTDIANPFTQVGRLYEGKTSDDTVDLAQLFNDPVVIPLLFNTGRIIWPSGATENSGWTPFAADWGTDPNSTSKPLSTYTFTLSMADAEQVADFKADALVYPNRTAGEVAYARCDVSQDRDYRLTLTSPATLPAGASIEVLVDGAVDPAYVFTTTGASGDAYQFSLAGNSTDASIPKRHFFQIRLLSPQTKQASSITLTVSLVPVS